MLSGLVKGDRKYRDIQVDQVIKDPFAMLTNCQSITLRDAVRKGRSDQGNIQWTIQIPRKRRNEVLVTIRFLILHCID